MNFLTTIFENSQFPILSAFILGLMTAISPCPLATNITAIGYISKDFTDRKQVLIRGVIYIIGRAITYTSIGLLIFFGASQFTISGFIQQWGEKLLGPLLIVVGLFMIGIIKPNFKSTEILSKRAQQLNQNRYIDVLLMGIVFALAFCPYSGVLYFGMLMPLTITNASGLHLPIVFAIATGIPALIFTWIIAYSASNISRSFNRVKLFEKVFRKIVALVFIGIGIYYIFISY
ncbi:aromatic aminobenezylarsenical efflux permease ArsG family transporter [Candidatus Neomarinimicrobiota bacterium]